MFLNRIDARMVTVLLWIVILLSLLSCKKTTSPVVISDPVIWPPTGYYAEAPLVSISCATDDARVFYTMDGSEPTTESAEYTTPFVAALGTRLQAKAFGSDLQVSNTASAYYMGIPPWNVGQCDTPGTAVAVKYLDGRAYIADGNSGLVIINVADYSNPFIEGLSGSLDYTVDVDVQNNYAYLATLGDSMWVIDISDPALPFVAGNCETGAPSRRVLVQGYYAYVACSDSGLIIINISDPNHPFVAGACDTPGEAVDIDIQGGYAYVADSCTGLQIIDISDPETPKIVGRCETLYALSLSVINNHALVASGEDGLQVIDVSDPNNPFIVGNYDRTRFANSVRVKGDLAFVTTDGLKVFVLNIKDPLAITESSSYTTPGRPCDAEGWGNTAFVAMSELGLQITELPTQNKTFSKRSYLRSPAAAHCLKQK